MYVRSYDSQYTISTHSKQALIRPYYITHVCVGNHPTQFLKPLHCPDHVSWCYLTIPGVRKHSNVFEHMNYSIIHNNALSTSNLLIASLLLRWYCFFIMQYDYSTVPKTSHCNVTYLSCIYHFTMNPFTL